MLYTLQKSIAATLKQSELLHQAGIEPIIQDQADLITAIKTHMQQLGVALVVAIDNAVPINTALEVTFSLIATETPALNRERSFHLTALQVAQTTIQTLIKPHYQFIDLTQNVTQDAIIQVITKYKVLIN